jgi:hypothetical protein
MKEPYVLVTYDNKMLTEHEADLRRHKTTLAVIDKTKLVASGLTQEQYWREVIHRHAHRFFAQDPGSIFKYHCSNRGSEVTLGA